MKGFESLAIEVLVPLGELVEGEAVFFGEEFDIGSG